MGGKYCLRMEAKDGSFGFDLEGVYSEIDAMKKIAHTMVDSRKVETVFEENSNEVVITTYFEPENQNPEEMQKQGWQSILNSFKKYAEEN